MVLLYHTIFYLDFIFFLFSKLKGGLEGFQILLFFFNWHAPKGAETRSLQGIEHTYLKIGLPITPEIFMSLFIHISRFDLTPIHIVDK